MQNIIHGDCMQLMPTYPDGYFDLAIVDPPYGIGFEEGGRWFKKQTALKNQKDNPGLEMVKKKTWDQSISDHIYFDELRRISKHQIIWGGNYFDLPPTRCVIAWTKSTQMQARTYSEWEMAWTSFQTVARYIEIKPFFYKGTRIHPTEKPVKLYRWLYRNYAKPEYKVIDTHLGSGSNAVAAHYFGISEFVGIEKDLDYFNDARQRIDMETRQQSLFV